MQEEQQVKDRNIRVLRPLCVLILLCLCPQLADELRRRGVVKWWCGKVSYQLHGCPHTTIFVSSYHYVRADTVIYVPSYYYVCALILQFVVILLHLCSQTAVCVLILMYVSSYYYICVLRLLYVSSY